MTATESLVKDRISPTEQSIPSLQKQNENEDSNENIAMNVDDAVFPPFLKQSIPLVDLRQQHYNSQYHYLTLARELKIPMKEEMIPDQIIVANELVVSIQDCLTPKALPKQVRSCTIALPEKHLAYIKNIDGLLSPFHTPIGQQPIGVAMDITKEECESIQIVNQTQLPIVEKPYNFWDPSRHDMWLPSLKTEPWGLKFGEDIERLENIASISEWTVPSKIFLTDACLYNRGYTRAQVIITALALQGFTYEKISYVMSKLETNCSIHRNRIKTCIIRTMQGNLWHQNMSHKEKPKLGFVDSLRLIAEVDLRIAKNHPPQTNEVCLRAKELYEARKNKARMLYNSMSGKVNKEMKTYLESLVPDFNTAWVGKFIKKAGFTLKTGFIIERERGISCTATLLLRWCYQHGALLDNYRDKGYLVYNMDETMVQLTKNKYKFVTLHGSRKASLLSNPAHQHITAVCCFSAAGDRVPLFLILPNSLENLPPDLADFERTGVYFATQKNGWMCHELFREWVKIFIQHINQLRARLPCYKEKNVLLTLDSHSSRACPEALKELQSNNITVLTFPPHCTHVLQPFDVQIGKELKAVFSKIYINLVKEKFTSKKHEETLGLPQYRYCAVSAIIRAYASVINTESAKSAFIHAGLCPFNSGIILQGRDVNFISPLDPEKEMRRKTKKLFITSEVITSDEMISCIEKAQESKKKKSSEKEVHMLFSK